MSANAAAAIEFAKSCWSLAFRMRSLIGCMESDDASCDGALPACSGPTLTLLATAASTGAAALYTYILNECRNLAASFLSMTAFLQFESEFIG